MNPGSSPAEQAPITFRQAMRRRDYLRLFVRRWPKMWEQRTATAPSWWMRLATRPMAVLMLLRKPGGFPVVHELEFSAQGVGLRMGEHQRLLPWCELRDRMELGDIWVLGAPGFDLPVFFAGLPDSTTAALQALLRDKVAAAESESLIGR